MSLIADITAITVEGKTVLEVDVPAGPFRPYYLKSKNKETSAYVRMNGVSKVADIWKLKELEMEGQRMSYDALPEIGMEYDEQQAKDLCKAMKQVALEQCKSQEERDAVKDISIQNLENFGVLRREGRKYQPTHAYRLLTVNGIKYAKIQCAVFKGTTRDIFIDRKEFVGPIYEQIEEAYQFILRHSNLGAEINGLYRRDLYELPMRAIREAIINAVGHRSYIDDSCVQISMYDDRVEIYSPGNLYGGLAIEDALNGKSKCRNSAISQAFHYMKLMETWGTGFERIKHGCKEYGLLDPRVEELGNGFRVTFYRYKDDGNTELSTQKRDTAGPKMDSSVQKSDTEGFKMDSSVQYSDNRSSEMDSGFQTISNRLCRIGVKDYVISEVKTIYEKLGKSVFKRNDIVSVLGCKKSKASLLIALLRENGIIESVSGHGQGSYKFVE